MSLLDSERPVWHPYYGSWILALIFDVLLFGLSLIIGLPSTPFEYTLLVIQLSRLLAFNLLLPLFFATLTRSALRDDTPVNEENTPLLKQTGQPNEDVDHPNTAHRSTTVETSSSDGADLEFEAEDRKKEQEERRELEKRLNAHGNWFTYAREFSIFIQYIWPSNPKDRKLQLNVLGVVICLACVRALNVLVPHQLGVVINALGASRNHLPLMAIGLYIFYLMASSSAGIQSIRRW